MLKILHSYLPKTCIRIYFLHPFYKGQERILTILTTARQNRVTARKCKALARGCLGLPQKQKSPHQDSSVIYPLCNESLH